MVDQQLRDLVREQGEPVMTTVYLAVDGQLAPRRAAVDARFAHLRRQAMREATMSGPEIARAVNADLDRIATWLTDFDRSDVRGVAAFSSARRGFFAALPLHRPVEDEATFGPTPRLVQLASALAGDVRLLVVLVDRQRARVLGWRLGELTELWSQTDELPRAVDTDVELGGFERREHEQLLRHVRAAASAAADAARTWAPGEVLVGGSAPAVDALLDLLPRDLAPGATRIALDARSAPSDIAEVAERRSVELGRRGEEDLVERLVANPQDARVVAGIDSTLAALADDRVGVLALARHLRMRGSRCPDCGRLDRVHAVRCVRCDGECIEIEDLTGAAAQLAISHGADVRLCDDSALQPIEGMGAITRY